MKVKYFRDTDTALLEFLDGAVVSIREINEYVYVELGAHGKVLSMTIEHARRNGRPPEVSVQQFDKPAVSAKGHR